MLTLWLAAAIQLAQTPAASPAVIDQPDWLRKPTGSEIVQYIPMKAIQKDVSGRVRIRCKVLDTGFLDKCETVEETPVGYGFGDAAVKMSVLFQMKPTTASGAPVGGSVVTIPIAFSLGKSPVPRAPSPK